jgi:hypothetical protein
MERPGEESLRAERGLTITYLGIRAIHLAQGTFCILTGWSRYRRPKLAAASLVVCGAEGIWLARRCRAAGTCEVGPGRVDTVTGLAGLLAMAAATRPQDRTTSLNWMMPLTVGSTLGLALTNKKGRDGFFAVGALSATYLWGELSGFLCRRRWSHSPYETIRRRARRSSAGGLRAGAAPGGGTREACRRARKEPSAPAHP